MKEHKLHVEPRTGGRKKEGSFGFTIKSHFLRDSSKPLSSPSVLPKNQSLTPTKVARQSGGDVQSNINLHKEHIKEVQSCLTPAFKPLKVKAKTLFEETPHFLAHSYLLS